MKLKSLIFVCIAVVLCGGILAFWYLSPTSDPEMDADIAALKTLGVPINLGELEALRAAGTPDAANYYASAATQYESGIAALSKAERERMLKLKAGDSLSAQQLKLISSLEPVWATLKKGRNEDSFVPNRPLIDWEVNGLGTIYTSHHGLNTYLQARVASAAHRGDKQAALETVELILDVGGQIGEFPGLVTNNVARLWLEHGFRLAGALGKAFPEDREFNEKLLSLVRSTPPVDLRKGFLLQPAIAFTILDSKRRIPWPYSPNSYQIALPGPAKAVLAEGKKTRQEAKAILADYYRNLLENYPSDSADSKEIFRLLQDERFDPKTFEGELASNLAIPVWRADTGRAVQNAREEALGVLNSNLSK